jgi:hypothetical protein
VQERFPELCAELQETFGWHFGEPPRHLETEPEPVDDALRLRIAEENALDVELYQFALQLCATRRAARASVGEDGAG